MSAPAYFALASPTEEHIYRHVVVPTAVWQKSERGQYGVEYDGKPLTIGPEQVAFTRLRMNEFDPRKPKLHTLTDVPILGTQPRNLRSALNKAAVRDLVRRHYPEFLQPDYWGFGIRNKKNPGGIEGISQESFGEIERKVRSGQTMYLKPWDGYSGVGVVKIQYNPRLKKIQFFTPDKNMESPLVENLSQRGRQNIERRRALTVQEFVRDVYIPIVKKPDYPAFFGGLVVENEIPELTEHKQEIRFFCMNNRVMAHYAKIGQGNLVANRAQGGSGGKSEETVRNILSKKFAEMKRKNPQYKPPAMEPLITKFLEETKELVEKVAHQYHQTAIHLNRTQPEHYPADRLSLDEVAVDVVPHFDEETQKVHPVLMEINSGRVAIKGLQDTHPEVYHKIMDMRRDIIEESFIKEVARREGRNGLFQDAAEARQYLDAVHHWTRNAAMTASSNGTLPRIRPKQGTAMSVRNTVAQLGVPVKAIRSEVPHPGLSPVQFELHPSKPEQHEKLKRAFELMGH